MEEERRKALEAIALEGVQRKLQESGIYNYTQQQEEKKKEKLEYKGTISMLKNKEEKEIKFPNPKEIKFTFCSGDKTYYIRFVPYGTPYGTIDTESDVEQMNLLGIQFFQDKDFQSKIDTPAEFSLQLNNREIQASATDFTISLLTSPRLCFNGNTIMSFYPQVQMGVNALEKSVNRL